MPRPDKLPPIPPADELARVPLPDLLVDPALGGAHRVLLFGVATLATKLPRIEGEFNLPVARPYSVPLFGVPFVLVVVGIFTVEWWVYLLLLWLLALVLLPLVALSGVALLARRRAVHARRTGRLVVPPEDFDGPSCRLLRAVEQAVEEVHGSRARREGHLPGGFALLREQRWRIANALARLSEARRLHESTGGRLAEHQRAVHATEQAIERRVRMVLAYARSVRRVDDRLADIDAASHTHTLDDRLRDSLVALGEDQSMAALATEGKSARIAVDEALRVLRHRTELLRSTTDEL